MERDAYRTLPRAAEARLVEGCRASRALVEGRHLVGEQRAAVLAEGAVPRVRGARPASSGIPADVRVAGGGRATQAYVCSNF